MDTMQRRTELLLDGTWVPIELKNLVIDDVFRMFEPAGKPVLAGSIWIVTGEPYMSADVWALVVNLKKRFRRIFCLHVTWSKECNQNNQHAAARGLHVWIV